MVDDAYQVIYGPAMDRETFPYTVDGLVAAVRFRMEQPASILLNPNRSTPDDPNGLTTDERDVIDLIENG